MTRNQRPSDLAPDAARYLDRMRSLERPIDLVDRIMAEVEATPQARPAWSVRPVTVFAAAAVAAVIVAIALLVRQPPNIGPPNPTQHGLPSAGEVVNRIPWDPTLLPWTFGHGYLWFGDSNSGELIRLDPDTGAVDTIDVAGLGGVLVEATVDETSVWADGPVGSLTQVDPFSLQEVRRIPTGVDANQVAVAAGVAWLLDRANDVVVRVNLDAETVDLLVPVESPSSILIDGNILWVGSENGVLTRVNAASGAVEDQFEHGGVAFSMAKVGSAILIETGALGGLVRIDINTGAIVHVGRGDTAALDAASLGDRLWSADFESGLLSELDPLTLQPISILDLELADVVLMAGLDALYAVGTDSAGDGYLLEVAPAP